MSQLLSTEASRTQQARRPDPVTAPAPFAAAESTPGQVPATTRGTVPCDTECPYCAGPETD